MRLRVLRVSVGQGLCPYVENPALDAGLVFYEICELKLFKREFGIRGIEEILKRSKATHERER